jgi:DMSO/TMAO reductase YedYZ molybdopterin-dependent catalytic subunit
VSILRSKSDRLLGRGGYDPRRLPPGQHLTDKWPVLHAGSVPRVDLSRWDFRVTGEVESPLTLTFDELKALPTSEVVVDIHCVTRWSRFDTRFTGVHWCELAKIVRPLPTARFAVAQAEQGYTANVPREAIEADDALIAWNADGAALSPDHGWPLRLVVPSRYFWKSAKWLRGIELRATDKPGFWENYGYHNDADPFKEERYGF